MALLPWKRTATQQSAALAATGNSTRQVASGKARQGKARQGALKVHPVVIEGPSGR
jgi:hypothetical protein